MQTLERRRYTQYREISKKNTYISEKNNLVTNTREFCKSCIRGMCVSIGSKLNETFANKLLLHDQSFNILLSPSV